MAISTRPLLPSRSVDLGTVRLIAVPGESNAALNARQWCSGNAQRARRLDIDRRAPDAARKVSDSRWLS